MMATVRHRNAKIPFEIHHDVMDPDESLEEEGHGMDDSRMEVEDEHEQDDAYSDTSEESDGIVDAVVQEDMIRFQETFRGIKERFRLINRIGEGNLPVTTYHYIY